MMDRNREARRGSMAAVNGISRRRQQQRSTNLRDSPEDGDEEMQESSRLRDRGVKKDGDRDRDRDRERSNRRSKRRRGEILMHGSNRDGEDSSEESMDDDEDEEDDSSVAVNSLAIPSSSIQQQNHHLHHRKTSFSAKSSRPTAALWKVAEEVIGVSIPRKARTSSFKRSQECGGGSGELLHRQASTSPARQSPNRPISPSSSNASIRKKKLSSGNKHRPPKMIKSPSLVQEIEMEVAEVLFGMTRQTPPTETKDTNGASTDAKSRVSSPNSISQTPSASQPSLITTAPKRKRPRLKVEDDSSASPASSVAPSTKMESEMPQKAEDVSSPRLENTTLGPPAVENGIGSSDLNLSVDAQKDMAKTESCNQAKQEIAILPSDSNVNSEEATAAVDAKAPSANERPPEEKFSIDLMVPLPEKSSSERDGISDIVSNHKSLDPKKKMVPGLETENGELKVEKTSKHEGNADQQNAGSFLSQEFDLKKQTLSEKIPNLQLNLEKHDKDSLSLSNSRKQQQVPKQQPKSGKLDSKQEKPVSPASMPLPLPVTGWPGGFPQFGYMGQVSSIQTIVPMNISSGAAKPVQQPSPFLQPQHRPKRCATHCYIAQNIHYHQQISRINPFWPSPSAGAAPLCGAKQYNLNTVPTSESAAILGNPLQGGYPLRSLSPLQDKSAIVTTTSPKEKSSAPAGGNSVNFLEAAQRNQFLLYQSPQPVSSSAIPHMTHAPAFMFPTNQQPAAVPNPTMATSKSIQGTANAAPSASASTAAADSGAAGHSSGNPMTFNYAGLSQNDAQYMAILQNNAYPFPIAAPPAAYRGSTPAQPMPLFNGPFYPPQMQMVPSQQQQQQLIQQLQQHQQQQHQLWQQQQQQVNPSTSSGSSSSHKQQAHQSQRLPGAGTHAASNSNRKHLRETRDNPSTADSNKASQAPKGLYGQNFVMPQNFALISGGGSHSENKQPGPQQQQQQALKVELTPHQAQAYAMSFASFGGSTAAAVPGFDYSAIVQNPALIQNLPDLAKHGFQIPAAAVPAAASAQHKKSHNEDGKSRGDSVALNANAVAEGKNATTAVGDGKNVGQQHSLSFSRVDNGPAIPNFASILGGGSHRLPNGGRPLIPPSSAGHSSSAPSSSAPSSSSSPSATIPPSSQQQQQQQQQQMIQFQKQQQRIIQMQQQLHQHQQLQIQQQQQNSPRPIKSSISHTTSSTNISSPSMATRFPLTGFPPSVQSPQWNASNRAASTSASASSATSSSSAKNHTPPQHQNHQPLLAPNPHQTHISFGVASSKNSNSVASNGGSPRASPSSKPGQPPTFPLQQQQAKNTPPITNTNNRSITTSILGHPHSNKLNTHQPQKQPQLFFNNPYNIQTQTSQAKAGYYHQQQQQPQ